MDQSFLERRLKELDERVALQNDEVAAKAKAEAEVKAEESAAVEEIFDVDPPSDFMPEGSPNFAYLSSKHGPGPLAISLAGSRTFIGILGGNDEHKCLLLYPLCIIEMFRDGQAASSLVKVCNASSLKSEILFKADAVFLLDPNSKIDKFLALKYDEVVERYLAEDFGITLPSADDIRKVLVK
jgi:hypothetical protein